MPIVQIASSTGLTGEQLPSAVERLVIDADADLSYTK